MLACATRALIALCCDKPLNTAICRQAAPRPRRLLHRPRFVYQRRNFPDRARRAEVIDYFIFFADCSLSLISLPHTIRCRRLYSFEVLHTPFLRWPRGAIGCLPAFSSRRSQAMAKRFRFAQCLNTPPAPRCRRCRHLRAKLVDGLFLRLFSLFLSRFE